MSWTRSRFKGLGRTSPPKDISITPLPRCARYITQEMNKANKQNWCSLAISYFTQQLISNSVTKCAWTKHISHVHYTELKCKKYMFILFWDLRTLSIMSYNGVWIYSLSLGGLRWCVDSWNSLMGKTLLLKSTSSWKSIKKRQCLSYDQESYFLFFLKLPSVPLPHPFSQATTLVFLHCFKILLL